MLRIEHLRRNKPFRVAGTALGTLLFFAILGLVTYDRLDPRVPFWWAHCKWIFGETLTAHGHVHSYDVGLFQILYEPATDRCVEEMKSTGDVPFPIQVVYLPPPILKERQKELQRALER